MINSIDSSVGDDGELALGSQSRVLPAEQPSVPGRNTHQSREQVSAWALLGLAAPGENWGAGPCLQHSG